MKKLMMFAAATLLLAGMMVSCKAKEEALTGIASVVKSDIQSVPALVMGKTEADAKKALLEAGFVEEEKEVMVVARKAKKNAPRKVAAGKESAMYIRQVIDNYFEVVEFESDGTSVYGINLYWMVLKAHYDAKTFFGAAQQVCIACYDAKTMPNLSGEMQTGEESFGYYYDGKFIEPIREEIPTVEELKEMLKNGELNQAEFEEYLAELSMYKIPGQPALVADLKSAADAEFCKCYADYSNDEAYENLHGKGKGTTGMVKMLMVEAYPEEEGCLVAYSIIKDHLDEF